MVGHKNGYDCMICLGPIEAGNEVAELICSRKVYHYFHKQCFENYLQNIAGPKFKCPMCKEPYDK